MGKWAPRYSRATATAATTTTAATSTSHRHQALVAVVAVARLYRGAHFPTDVLGSVLFAVPWLLVVLRVLPPAPDGGPGG